MSFINCQIVGKGTNPAVYHAEKAERGDPNFKVSPSMLKEFMRCPSRWRAGYESPESKSKDFGSLLDCRLLTPGQFDARYVMQPETYASDKGDKPWSNNATVCREWNAAQLAAGKEIVSADELADCDAALKRLKADPIIASWLAACETQVLVEANWQDEATGLFVPVRCLIDFEPRADSEFARCLGDLKSARTGSLFAFADAVHSMGYDFQAAFDLDLYNGATNEARNCWCIIGQENYAPWEPFRRMLSPEYITIGRRAYDTALRLYCRCLKTDTWPGYDDHPDATQGWSEVAPKPWMEYESVANSMAASVSNDLTMEQKLEMAGLG